MYNLDQDYLQNFKNGNWQVIRATDVTCGPSQIITIEFVMWGLFEQKGLTRCYNCVGRKIPTMEQM